MRKALLTALAGLLSIGVAGSAGAATLAFTGTLQVNIGTMHEYGGGLVQLTVGASGSAIVNASAGGLHLTSMIIPTGVLGPATVTFPGSQVSGTGISSLRLTLAGNLTGSFFSLSGGPPGGGTMGLSGIAKICLTFGGCDFSPVPFPLTPTASGAGFGIGGTRTTTAGPVDVTLQNAPWTIGQPVMTFHTPGTSAWTPTLPGGFAHGPASLTSSTAQPSGALQLVTVSKAYTSLTSGFPEIPLTAVLTVHFVPEPSALLMLGSGIAVLAIYRRRSHRR